MPKTTAPPLKPSSRITPGALPAATYFPQDPTKKSHARRQPAGHIPRPRNAFILFRCDFVRQQKVPQDVASDHRTISRVAGGVWRAMSAEDREPWVRMAEREKVEHLKAHPGYRYTPHIAQPVGVRGRKKGDGHGVGDGSEVGMAGPRGMERGPLRRTSSCPPLPDPQEPPRREDESKGVAQSLPHLPLQIPRIPTRLRGEVQHIRPQIVRGANTYELGPGFQSAWKPDAFPFIPKPSTTAATTATTLPDANVSTGPAAALPPSFLALRRPSSCPPGARRISSSQLTHPSATSALQMTRDDLSSRRPSRIPMYQSSAAAFTGSGSHLPSHNYDRHQDHTDAPDLPLALTYLGGGRTEPAHAHDLGKNTRPPLLDGPYRIDPPRDAPGWDAPPPRAYPWAWGWGGDEEDLVPRTAFDYLDLPQHLFGEVTRSDLQDISRAGLESISPVDVDAMFHAQDPGTAAPPPPVFTNPFASAFPRDPAFGPRDTGGEAPVPRFATGDRDRDGLGFNHIGGSGRARPGLESLHDEDPGEADPRQPQARRDQETLIGLLFPRMSLDDRTHHGGDIDDGYHYYHDTKNDLELDEIPYLSM